MKPHTATHFPSLSQFIPNTFLPLILVQNKSLILEHMDQPDLVFAGTKIRGRKVFGINCDKEGK